MPIMDFIKNLQFKLTDINPQRPASTIESLSKCITDKLEDMDETERPVHCSDAKRLVFHVKDASGWTKDVNNKKIDKAIRRIRKKIRRSQQKNKKFRKKTC